MKNTNWASKYKPIYEEMEYEEPKKKGFTRKQIILINLALVVIIILAFYLL